MMRWDKACRIPSSTLDFASDIFIMHEGFGKLLWKFLAEQHWTYDDSAFSVAELYVLFLPATGWYVPVNVSSHSNDTKPAHARARPGTIVWAHEAEYPQLTLARRQMPLGVQIRTFRHVLQAIFAQQGIP